MDKQRISAFGMVIGLFLLHGCGGANSVDSTIAVPPGGAGDEGALVEPTPQASPVFTSNELEVTNAIAASSDRAEVGGDLVSSAADDPGGSGTRNETVESEQPETQGSGADRTKSTGNAAQSYKVNPSLQFDVTATAGPVEEPLADANEVSDSAETTRLNDDASVAGSAVSDAVEATAAGPNITDATGVATITDLIFLTGQSNAASLVTKYDADLDSPDERVFAYTDLGWKVADLHQFWDEGIPGNFSADNPDREPYNNIIFQVGKALAHSADRRVGIVMLTAPGEGISHWDYGSPFYNKVRDRAITALNAVPHKSSFDGLVWMQGETDWLLHGTADPDIADFESYQSEAYLHYYPRKLAQLIEALRSDPWFGDRARFVCTETIKAAVNFHLMGLNSDGDSLTGCAAASDLAARENDPHGNHFSAGSLRVLGQRIADVYLNLEPPE